MLCSFQLWTLRTSSAWTLIPWTAQGWAACLCLLLLSAEDSQTSGNAADHMPCWAWEGLGPFMWPHMHTWSRQALSRAAGSIFANALTAQASWDGRVMSSIFAAGVA